MGSMNLSTSVGLNLAENAHGVTVNAAKLWLGTSRRMCHDTQIFHV